MKLGSVVELPGRLGDHAALNGERCSGRRFSVISVGVGGVYRNEVECDNCHMRLTAYENGVVDPFAAAVRDTTAVPPPGIFRVSTDYRFRRLNMNGTRSDPETWFRSEQDARAVFDFVTQDAAFAAWRPGDQELLQSVTVSLSIRERNVWKHVGEKTFRVVLAAVDA